MRARTLVLMRHSKSDYPGGVADHDRPLAGRGRNEAALGGKWLQRNVPRIDEILSSTATRTRQTAEFSKITAPVRLAEEIYEAYPGAILEQIRLTAPAVTTLLVVGHAPGMPGLAAELAGPDSDPDATRRLSGRFPTSAIAVFTFTGEWADLRAGSARLTAYHIPRD